jgi:hypothetical protein
VTGATQRIQGALVNLGHSVARSAIAEILKRHGIEPAPERSRKTKPGGAYHCLETPFPDVGMPAEAVSAATGLLATLAQRATGWLRA